MYLIKLVGFPYSYVINCIKSFPLYLAYCLIEPVNKNSNVISLAHLPIRKAAEKKNYTAMSLFLIQLGHMCSISENIAMIKHY